MIRRYIANDSTVYEATIEACRAGYLIRIDGLPMVMLDTVQEAEAELEQIAHDLLFQPLPENL